MERKKIKKRTINDQQTNTPKSTLSKANPNEIRSEFS